MQSSRTRIILLVALVAAVIGGVATYGVSALTSTARRRCESQRSASTMAASNSHCSNARTTDPGATACYRRAGSSPPGLRQPLGELDSGRDRLRHPVLRQHDRANPVDHRG